MPPDSLETVRRDINRRLRPILADMPEAEFETLVAGMAEIEWKYLHRDPLDRSVSKELWPPR